MFGRYELAQFSDWHYAGFDRTLLYDHKLYSDRGPEDFGAFVVGVFFRLSL